ncbi:MCE family protein [Jatrophihabitans sp. GAS493]|uniref:MCE family protein n=1 Tax=Jatrophihabitans sp. GAS493 TaxID=1907575 RepID=UPI0012FE034F|nr:MCE family protein [Jatrophihabitans sp. GAS493]
MNATRIKMRIYGVIFLVVLLGLVGLSIAAYQKRFTKVTDVVLKTDFTGNQLQPQSDVKVRGIEVGEVRAIHATTTGANVELALDPSKLDLVPSNVLAQLLPKTLFGEQYVALILPENPEGNIEAGDTIHQDTSYQAAQISDLLRHTQPVLDALSPAELNATLTALATALRGRGDQIGQSLVKLDIYLKKLNPSVPQLATDLVNIGKVAATYDAALPDILSTLDHLRTTSATITTKSAALANFLTLGTSTSDALTAFFKANGNQIINLASTSVPVLQLFAKYAPEYTCILSATTKLDKNAQAAFAGGVVKVTVRSTQPMGRYLAGDEPKVVSAPPSCSAPLGKKFDDGAAPYGGTGSGAYTKPSTTIPGTFGPNSLAERQLIGAVVAAQTGTEPSDVTDISTIVAGPILRGSSVEVSAK